jgi:hypothetical protein
MRAGEGSRRGGCRGVAARANRLCEIGFHEKACAALRARAGARRGATPSEVFAPCSGESRRWRWRHRELQLTTGRPSHGSLFSFLHRELGLSKGAAYYRKVAAELVQRFPEVIAPLRDGRLCFTSVVELAKVLTPRGSSSARPGWAGSRAVWAGPRSPSPHRHRRLMAPPSCVERHEARCRRRAGQTPPCDARRAFQAADDSSLLDRTPSPRASARLG